MKRNLNRRLSLVKLHPRATVRQCSRSKFLLTGPRASSMPLVVDFKHDAQYPANKEGNKVGRKYLP